MKRILFALSLLLVLGISTDVLSQAPPKTTYNEAEVELMINEKVSEITDKTRAEIKEQGDRLWNKVGIELGQSREELEDARAMLSRELDDAKADLYWWLSAISIILMVVIGGGGIGIPVLLSRELKAKLESEVEMVKARAIEIEGESYKNKYEVEKVRVEAEDALEKIKTVLSDAKWVKQKLFKNIDPTEPLTNITKSVVYEFAEDRDVSNEDRIRANALKAQDEGRWESAKGSWEQLKSLKLGGPLVTLGIAYAIQRLSEKTGKDEGLKDAVDIYEELSNTEFGESKARVLNNFGNALADQAEMNEEKADELYKEAYEKYKEAADIKPDYSNAFYNWGCTLSQQANSKKGEEADKLFEEACEKYKKATDIKPDEYKAFSNWGNALSKQAETKKGSENVKLLEEAKEKHMKAEAIKVGSASYNLACFAAVQGKKEECRKWLEKARAYKTLTGYKEVNEDKDFDNVRNEPWFKELLEELRKEEEAKKS